MKTQILTIATIFTLALGTVTSASATVKNNNEKEVSTTLTNISQINKIEIHGNVELYVSDGAADQVKVYNRYYAESALVQNQNGVLRISSYTDKKLDRSGRKPLQQRIGTVKPGSLQRKRKC
jgi:hypothetical protein